MAYALDHVFSPQGNEERVSRHFTRLSHEQKESLTPGNIVWYLHENMFYRVKVYVKHDNRIAVYPIGEIHLQRAQFILANADGEMDGMELFSLTDEEGLQKLVESDSDLFAFNLVTSPPYRPGRLSLPEYQC
ncbi:MAG: hypothetical protein ABIH34_07500 [Nanoarchaeota archaeon]